MTPARVLLQFGQYSLDLTFNVSDGRIQHNYYGSYLDVSQEPHMLIGGAFWIIGIYSGLALVKSSLAGRGRFPGHGLGGLSFFLAPPRLCFLISMT